MPEEQHRLQLRLSPKQLLHRESLLARERSEIVDEVTALPGFDFSMPTKKLDQEFMKVMVRGFAQLIAGILQVESDHPKATLFVLLIKFEQREDGAFFSLYCPHHWLVDKLRRAAEDHAERDSLSSMSGDIPIAVRAVFIPDTQIPLVFHFDRDTKRLTVSNEYHLTASAQFLLPDRGNTTSGLLNAIGVLSLINAADPGQLKNYLEEMIRTALSSAEDANDEWLRWIYHLIDSSVFFAPRRILVSKNDGERFFYDYTTLI